jgi:hypothetical protein
LQAKLDAIVSALPGNVGTISPSALNYVNSPVGQTIYDWSVDTATIVGFTGPPAPPNVHLTIEYVEIIGNFVNSIDLWRDNLRVASPDGTTNGPYTTYGDAMIRIQQEVAAELKNLIKPYHVNANGDPTVKFDL